MCRTGQHWIRKTKNLLSCDTCLWLVCSVQCFWLWKLHRAIVSDWWYTQQTLWKLLGLLTWTDAEGWAGKKGGEGGASKCSCLDRTETEDCVKSSVHVPEVEALFCSLLKGIIFSPTSMSLFVLHGHHLILEVTQALAKALLLQAAALYHLKLEERQLQARAWSSPNCSEGKFSSTWKRRVGFIYLHFPLKSKPFSTAVRWTSSSPGLAQWAVFILPMLGLWHSHCRASTLVLLLSDPFPC